MKDIDSSAGDFLTANAMQPTVAGCGRPPRGCDAFVAKIVPDFVQIDGCETVVVNQVLDEGHFISERIAECAVDHGEFVSCVAQLTNDWNNDGTITGGEKGKIQSCASPDRR